MKSKIKLVIFDLDDTLTRGPTIWELIHRENGTWKSHGIRYWKEFRQGKFGFNAFIRKDVASWKGMPLFRVKKALSRTKFVSQAGRTMRALKRRGIKIALVSSSLELFALSVAKKFGIEHVHANVLEVKQGRLTGKIKLTVPGLGKGRLTRNLKRKLNLKKNQVMAVGDSAYDIPMFREVGQSITFTDAKLEVKKAANYIISKRGLYGLIKIVLSSKIQSQYLFSQ